MVKRRNRQQVVYSNVEQMGQTQQQYLKEITPKNIEDEEKTQKPKDTQSFYYKILAILIILMGVFVIFSFTSFLSIFSNNWTNLQKTFSQVLTWIIIITIIYVIIFFYLKNIAQKREIKTRSPLRIPHPEKMLPEIRKLSQENYGIRLGNCLRIGNSPFTGEASAIPYKNYYYFEMLNGRGKFSGWALWTQSLIQDEKVFKPFFYYWNRESNESTWFGETKRAVPQRLTKGELTHKEILRIPRQEEIEEYDDMTE